MTLQLEVLTPMGTVFSGTVEEVVAPLPDGWIGILPGHAPFLARILPGVVAFQSDGAQRQVATRGGTLLVAPDRTTVLTGAALLDGGEEDLEGQLGQEAARLAEMEAEAERHFDRVYRQLARTFKRRR